jgi:hypothetical protein
MPAGSAQSSYYLECDTSFTELRASELLIAGLQRGRGDRKILGDVAIIQLQSSGYLVREWDELDELRRIVLEQKDTNV